MREVTLRLNDNHPVNISTDGEIRPCNGFLLIANVPADPPGCVMLNYGNSNSTGNMLMTLWQRSVHEHPELAWVIEQVARGIVEMADKERASWPSDEGAGRA